MPEVEYTTRMALSREVVWEFVKDMNNWAPMLTGYQQHEILDETDSVWTLKGDVGILSRVVKLQAHVTEWIDRERVVFTLTGLNEKVDGGGELVMSDVVADAPPPPAPRKRWFGRRFLDWLARRMFKRMHGDGPKRLEAGPAAAGAGGPTAQLTFTLRMDAGGPTGPLVNAMLGPALLPAAEDLANKIAAHLERVHLRTDAAA
ncbi:MAG TPA: SRPBCC family protein [Kofleriaceae bacterium]|nr:SRPBCC family protein [Kofleriaceae bacterium]